VLLQCAVSADLCPHVRVAEPVAQPGHGGPYHRMLYPPTASRADAHRRTSMVRIRHGWTVAVIGLAFAFAACKKDATDAGGGGKTGTSDKGGSSDDLSLLPVDSEVVLGINFGQVQQSPLWKQFVEPKLQGSGEMAAKLAEFKAKCGYDAMGSIKSVSLGAK